MPQKDVFLGLFGSYYESDFEIQHRGLNQELKEYNNFLYYLNKQWKDDKKNEFFKKHINGSVDVASSYMFHSGKLIELLEEARILQEI